MYKKLIYLKDKKNFGSQIVIYKSDYNFLIIINERDGQAYYFLDNNLEYLYPMNTYMQNINFTFDFNNICKVIERDFDINLLQYGHSKCQEYIKDIIKEKRITTNNECLSGNFD